MTEESYQSIINEVHLLAELKKPCIIIYLEDFDEDSIRHERVAMKMAVNSFFEAKGMITGIAERI